MKAKTKRPQASTRRGSKKPVKSKAKTSRTRSVVKARAKTKRRVIRHSVELAVCYPKKLLVPHKANHYKPHLIRWKGLVALLALVLLGQGVYNFATSGHFAVLGRTTTTSIIGLWQDTNTTREKQGLPKLKLNKKLDQAAYAKAQDMLKNNYWAHVSPGGVQPWSWIDGANYNYSEAGENLAKNYPSSEATLKAWLASPTHRANVLNKNYTDVGFAVVSGQLQGQQTNLVVAMYAQPESAAVLASTSKTSPGAGFAEPAHKPQNMLASLGTSVQSLSPVTVGSILLIFVAIMVAIATYGYKDMVPKQVKKRRHKGFALHHAVYKTTVLLAFVILLVISTHGGQI